MDSVIEQLWNGTIAPARNCGTCDPEMEDLLALLERNRRKLEAGLDQNQKAVWDNYLGCMEEYVYLISVDAFRDGFSLAARMMGEATWNHG